MKISCPWFISLRLQSIAESIKKGRSSKLSHSRTPSNASSTSAEVAELTAEAAPTSEELATSAASSVDSQLIDVPLERSEFLSLTSISLIWCLVVVRHFLIFWKWLYRLNGLKSIQYLFFIIPCHIHFPTCPIYFLMKIANSSPLLKVCTACCLISSLFFPCMRVVIIWNYLNSDLFDPLDSRNFKTVF